MNTFWNILRRKYQARLVNKQPAALLREKCNRNNHYKTISEGYIYGRVRFKTVELERFTWKANRSNLNRPRMNVNRSETGTDRDVIGAWLTVPWDDPFPGKAFDADVNKYIEKCQLKYYVVATVTKSRKAVSLAQHQAGCDELYNVYIFLYTAKWRKFIGEFDVYLNDNPTTELLYRKQMKETLKKYIG